MRVRRPTTHGPWGLPLPAAPVLPRREFPKSAHGVTSPSEHDHRQAAAFRCSAAAPLLRFRSPSAQSLRDPLHPGLPHPVRSAFRVSHPPDGLLPRRPSGLVSCRSRSWGYAPSELSPPHEALAPLDARNLPDVGCTPPRSRPPARRTLPPRNPRSDDTGLGHRLDVPLAFKAWHLGGVRLPSRGV